MWNLFGGGQTSTATEKAQSTETSIDKCPVDEDTRRSWLSKSASTSDTQSSNSSTSSNTSSALAFLNSKPDNHQTVSSDGSKLSKDRVVSSIPRFGAISETESSSSASSSSESSTSSNWVYPSPSQFFSAMSRKNHNPRAEDMNIVVPIHNAVNERAWNEILEWEKLADEETWKSCGGPKLVSFKGRPKDVTWKAWSRSLLGYQLPFDRHDWEVDRCGKRIRYVIDFYTGRSNGKDPSGLSFYLDVRPSPAEIEGWRMRLLRMWKSTFS